MNATTGGCTTNDSTPPPTQSAFEDAYQAVVLATARRAVASHAVV
ncbi:hypothetical protein DSM43518_03544 [Mycobacterium marinum]|nr:hypothetical protein [Mycobacterium marinum]RFZ07076.1 hypothetical protein DSM43518_03544 [Mycobacterium marinum]